MKKRVLFTITVVMSVYLAMAQTPVAITIYEDCQRMGGSYDLRPTTDPNDKAPDKARWIDLGLPSGLLWANMNIGAKEVTDIGSYFAWGETTTKTNYTTAQYRFFTNGSTSKINKYNGDYTCGDNGFTDNKSILDIEDDAAHAQWGSNWRIPTQEEWQELIDNCTFTSTTQNGSTSGYLLTSKNNGNQIFLPGGGYRSGSSISNSGHGYYWSSTLSGFIGSSNASAKHFYFYTSKPSISSMWRYNGLPIRAVRTR